MSLRLRFARVESLNSAQLQKQKDAISLDATCDTRLNDAAAKATAIKAIMASKPLMSFMAAKLCTGFSCCHGLKAVAARCLQALSL